LVIRGVVFDLDDTLYPESDYVLSGFEAVAADAGVTAEERAELRAWLSKAFASGVRGDTFDRIRERFPAVAGRVSTARMVERYRQHRPALTLTTGVASVLDALAGAGLRLGIISDGPRDSQAAKVEALGMAVWCSPIVLTETLGPGMGKPHPAAFQLVQQTWGLEHQELVYVADNPQKDFVAPRQLGWHSIRLRQVGQLHEHVLPAGPSDAPDLEIAQLTDLPIVLAGLA
jgi:putative hydrolase of the HAD superfamily